MSALNFIMCEGSCSRCYPFLTSVQILELYKQYIDPEFTWSNFTIEEQAKVIVAPRSNNLLDTERVCLLAARFWAFAPCFIFLKDIILL